MRFVSKLYISLGILLALALGSASLAAWSSYRSDFHVERNRLSHGVYQAYLSLSNHTYQLFKQIGDEMLLGKNSGKEGDPELLKKIRKDIVNIRTLIGLEIELVGEEEIEELELLAQIERRIESLLKRYQTTLAPHDWGTFSRAVDQNFSRLMQEAIDEEAREVVETTAETKAKIRLFKTLVIIFSIIAIFASIASLWKLLQDLRKPLFRLIEGASMLSEGHLEHQIDISKPHEFKEVARAFNHMSTELLAREKSLKESNMILEKSVAARTKELEQLLDEIKSAAENRRRLFADVSHELRTPLTIIHGEADIALRGDAKDSNIYRDALERCRSAAARTARLINDLLLIARGEAKEIRLRFQEFDLSQLLPQIIGEYRNIVGTHGYVISFNSIVKSAIVRADADRIQQVVLALLENAFRYGGRNIEVQLAQTTSTYEVKVSDDGPGMTEEEQANAFERFLRGSRSADRHESGTGLGLPIAKAIIEAHGGTILLSGEPGQGLSVTFSIPRYSKLRAVS